MSLYKRKDSPHWWIKFTVNGRRLQSSTGTADKQKAREYHDKLKAQLWDESRLGVKPKRIWQEAALRYLNETTHKVSQVDDKMHLRWLDKYLGGMVLNAINRDLVDRIQAARMAEGVSNSTVNRTMEVVRKILRRACFDWEWLDRVPKVRMLPKPERRIRDINREEVERLIVELPPHLAAMVRFSVATGLRQKNASHLEWSQVDIARRCAWVHADQAKARKAMGVPLSDEAMAVLENQKGLHDVWVFPYQGKPVEQPNNWAWRKALKRAGIKGFRWHDLRHTWATWHAKAGTPLFALQELGGWASVEMVRRYAHLSAEHLAQYADRMAKTSGGSTIPLRSEEVNDVEVCR